MEGQGRKKDDQTSKTTKETQDENKAILNTMVKLLIQQTEATTKLGTYVQKMYEGMETLITSIKAQEQIGKDLKKVTETCLADVRTLSEKVREVPTNTEISEIIHSTAIEPNNTEWSEIQNQTNNTENITHMQSLNEMTKTFANLNKTLECNIQRKFNIKRDYKLTTKSNLDLWLDSLNSELAANDLLEVLNNNNDNSEKTMKEKNIIRDIIINRLDSKYHQEIIELKDPKDILLKIKEIKRLETNMTHVTVKVQKLYSIKKSQKEKAVDFFDRFDNIIREYEICNSEIELTEKEIRAAFYNAVSDSSPELRTAYIVKGQTGPEMTIEQMKTCLLQIEATRQNTNTFCILIKINNMI
ncbi:uncharacterized protein [Linepithema humile]|uniref:uncharacterized protein n=1 Tax=Linepithema humile TaxID=83485 RepID=UPI00351E2D65